MHGNKKRYKIITAKWVRLSHTHVKSQRSLLMFNSAIWPNKMHTSEEDWRNIKVKVKWSRYRPGVTQTVGRGIALLFYDRDTRRGWVVSSTPRPHFTPGKDPVPILQEAGWTPGPVWTGGKPRPHRDSIPDRPARSQSLYRLGHPAHSSSIYETKNKLSKIAQNQFVMKSTSSYLVDGIH